MDKEFIWFVVIMVFCTLFIILPTVIGSAYFEMRAFNKFSEQKATLTDAMFSRLRIVAKND